MPKVELLKPRSLNLLGRIWTRGVEEDVDFETARALVDNPRFKVRGLSVSATEADEETAKPKDKETLYAAIREAADQLDVDDESAFTSTGKPNQRALSEILGYTITAAERDAAIAPKTKTAEPETESGSSRAGVRITKVSGPKAQKQAALDRLNKVEKKDKPTGEADENRKDDSTEGAVSVE
ncbi:hypothetical protein [Sinorhizobium fredii]|uniref:hypothetical protein n=1 Tax=Rhizobium fredii TaxID=380 RepID=UPI001295CBAC|nr:hypothetical protein [Sinorhizobium fredii]MQW94039.1 hypothetical protein [Sinorhizobium fredii]